MSLFNLLNLIGYIIRRYIFRVKIKFDDNSNIVIGAIFIFGIAWLMNLC